MIKVNKELLTIILLSIITLIADSFGLKILMLLKLAIYIIVLLKCKKENLIKYFIIFSCLSTNILLYILNVIFGFVYIGRNYKKIIIDGKTGCFIFLAIWEVLHIWTILKYNLPMNLILNQLAGAFTFIICGIYINDESIKNKPQELLNTYIVSTIFMGIILFIKRIDYYGLEKMFLLHNGIGKIPTDNAYKLMMNPNAVSRKMGLAFSLLITRIGINRRMTKGQGIQIISIIFLGLMTFSLSFMLYSLISVLIILFYEIFIKRKTKTIFKILITVILIILTITFLIKYNIINKIYDVYKDSLQAEDISNGRINIYKQYIDVMKENISIFILGRGLNTYSISLINSIEMEQEILVHNTILEILLSWGIIGLSVCIVLFYKIVSDHGKSNFYKYIPTICLLLYMMTGNFFISYYSNLIMIVIIYAVYFLDKEGVKYE